MSDRISNLSPRGLISAVGLVVIAPAAIGVIDLTTGPDYGLALIYLIPIAIAGWRLGSSAAIAAAITSGVAGYIADYSLFGATYQLRSIWDGVSSLIIYLSLGIIASLLRSDRDQLRNVTVRLRELLAHESESARTDALTRLPNRRGLLDHLEREIANAGRNATALAVMFLDLDNFKRVNDVAGHAAGDLMLQRVAQVLREAIRAGDLAARIGGDEFAIVLSPADASSAEDVAQRLVDRIEALQVDIPGSDFGASVGIAIFDSPPRNADDALGRADAAMYRSKTGGKGRYTMAWVTRQDATE